MEIVIGVTLYLISVITSWFLIRAWLKFGNMEANLIFVVIMFFPVINTIAPIMFMGFLGIDRLMDLDFRTKINFNKIFKL